MAQTVAIGVEHSVRDLDEGVLLPLIADAYRDAALAGANMRKATDALEAIRKSSPAGSHFDVWSAIDGQIGLADEVARQRVLVGVRERFSQEVIARELARLREAFAANPRDGWVEWLRSYSAALDRWRWPLLKAISEAELPFPPDLVSDVEDIRRWTTLAAGGRWPEAQELFLYLVRYDALPNDRRGALYVYAAQVELYYLLLPERALVLIEQAEELAADSVTVALGRAEYELQRGNYDEVRSRCEQVRGANPDNASAYNLIGQAYDREDDLEAAERWYLDAMKVEPGDSSAYLNLLRLYGRPEQFADHEASLASLLDRLIAVDPDGEYNGYVELGAIYQQSARYAEAHPWYERAIALDPARISAYVQKGYTASIEGNFAEAERLFQTVVDVAPNAFDGYWGLAGVYEAKELWEQALDWFRQSLAQRPEWRSSILGRTGAILISLGRYDEAEAELLEALRLDPASDSMTSTLERFVVTNYHAGLTDAAARILDAVHEIKGPAYEATYSNLFGNMAYYLERYDEAMSAFERAIELQPEDPVLHANLASAWELRRLPAARAEELGHAIAAERRAGELDPANPEYQARLATMLTEQTVIRVSGESALSSQWAPPLRVDVSRALLPSIVDKESVDLSPELLTLIESTRESIRARTGILVPGIRFRELESDDEALYVIAIHGTPLPAERVQDGEYFCPAPLEPLVQAGIPATAHSQALLGAWIDAEHQPAAVEAGISLQTPVQYMLSHLESVLHAHLEQFVGHGQVKALLTEAGLGAEVTDSPPLFTEFVIALRALVRERVPVVALDPIYQSFVALARDQLNRVDLVERLRGLPEILPSLPGNDSSVRLFRLDPALEADLGKVGVRTEGEPLLALPHRDRRADAIVRQAKPRHGEQVALVVESRELRPFVWALVESFSNVCVISRDELLPERLAQFDAEVAAP